MHSRHVGPAQTQHERRRDLKFKKKEKKKKTQEEGRKHPTLMETSFLNLCFLTALIINPFQKHTRAQTQSLLTAVTGGYIRVIQGKSKTHITGEKLLVFGVWRIPHPLLRWLQGNLACSSTAKLKIMTQSLWWGESAPYSILIFLDKSKAECNLGTTPSTGITSTQDLILISGQFYQADFSAVALAFLLL